MSIVEISVQACFEEPQRREQVVSLCQAALEEIEHDYAIEAAPNWQAYMTLQDAGALIALGVFDDSVMVGYGFAVIAPSLHYDLLNATNDSIYVLPQYRKKGYGYRLMLQMQRLAKARGARYMVWQAKAGSPLNDVLQRMGCKMEEVVYTKEL